MPITPEHLKVDPHDTLWVTDTEIIRRSGWPDDVGREALRALDEDRRSTFPQKQKLFGNRRYWPAVLRYFERISGYYPPEQRRSA